MIVSKKSKGRRAQGQMEQRAKLDSTSEIRSQYDAIQLNLKGSCTVNGSRGSTAILNVCVWEVQGGLYEWDGLWLDDDHNVVQIGSNKQHVFFRL